MVTWLFFCSQCKLINVTSSSQLCNCKLQLSLTTNVLEIQKSNLFLKKMRLLQNLILKQFVRILKNQQLNILSRNLILSIIGKMTLCKSFKHCSSKIHIAFFIQLGYQVRYLKHFFTVLGKMFIFMDTIANSGKMHRDMGLRQYMAPIPAFTSTDMKYSEYSQYFHTSVCRVVDTLR